MSTHGALASVRSNVSDFTSEGVHKVKQLSVVRAVFNGVMAVVLVLVLLAVLAFCWVAMRVQL